MGKKGRLGQVARNNLRKCFTKAIKRHARAGILSIAEQDLKQGLLASLYHNLKNNKLPSEDGISRNMGKSCG